VAAPRSRARAQRGRDRVIVGEPLPCSRSQRVHRVDLGRQQLRQAFQHVVGIEPHGAGVGTDVRPAHHAGWQRPEITQLDLGQNARAELGDGRDVL
jgi:hypothetical protein